MIIAVCSPAIFESPISERLIQKVENATLDKSWIPETDNQRRLKFEREKLKESQNKLKADTMESIDSMDTIEEPSQDPSEILYDSGIDEDGHTFIYTIGHASVERSARIGHDAAKLSVKSIQLVQSLVENIISKSLNLVFFTIRSTLCTFTSMVLLGLYVFQLLLRIIKLGYSGVEWVLMYICSCVNDISLLAVEIIQESSMSNGEDIYVKLKESVDKLRNAPSALTAVSSDSTREFRQFESRGALLASPLDSDASLSEISSVSTTDSELNRQTTRQTSNTSFKLW